MKFAENETKTALKQVWMAFYQQVESLNYTISKFVEAVSPEWPNPCPQHPIGAS
jgi:hypothetical protein